MLKAIEVWDGSRYRKVIGKVMTPSGLRDFYRPINFADNMTIYSGLTKLSSSGVIDGGKLGFDTLIRYSIKQAIEETVKILVDITPHSGFATKYIAIPAHLKVVSGTARNPSSSRLAVFDVLSGAFTGDNFCFDQCVYEPINNRIRIRTYSWTANDGSIELEYRVKDKE